jgi:ABC-type phosphate/phosphonate transport system substrate-binding protein
MAMMCGLPYSQRTPRPVLIAAPLPSPARYGGQPVYFTDLAVRADAAFQKLEDTFGGVLGYTLEDSMSGCVAPRRYLRAFRTSAPLYRKAIGGFVNARQIIEALAAGRIDVGPLDSYYHDLLRRNDREFADQVRIIATTPAAPIPPLIATAAVDVEPLRLALLEVASVPELLRQRETLLLSGFAIPREADYEIFASLRAQSLEYEGSW